MSQEFRPYLTKKFGVGLLPNLNTRHVVGDGQITTYKSLVGQVERQAGVHRISDKTVVDSTKANVLGYGDIQVSTEGSVTLYEKIAAARSFVAAIEAEKAKLYASANPWNQGLSDSDLQDIAIIIPSPHTMLSYTFQGVNGGLVRWYQATNTTKFDDGDWVQRGDVIGTVQPFEVVTPVTGRLMFSGKNSTEGYGWDNELAWARHSSMGFKDRLKDMSFAIVQPLKGEPIPSDYVRVAYQDAITRATQALNQLRRIPEKKLRTQFHNNFRDDQDTETVRRSLIEYTETALEVVQRAKPHTIKAMHIEDVPDWASREWIAEFAPNAGLDYIAEP